MNKYEEMKTHTLENLVTSFWSLYSEQRIEKITVKAITELAGYNRGTFYKYFKDVYNVLEFVEHDLLALIENKVIGGLKNPTFENLMNNMIEVYDQHGSYFSLLLSERGDPYFASKIKSTLRPLLRQAFALPDNDIRIDYALEFALSGYLATITYWYQKGKSLPIQEICDLLSSALLGGLVSELEAHAQADTNIRAMINGMLDQFPQFKLKEK